MKKQSKSELSSFDVNAIFMSEDNWFEEIMQASILNNTRKAYYNKRLYKAAFLDKTLFAHAYTAIQQEFNEELIHTQKMNEYQKEKKSEL